MSRLVWSGIMTVATMLTTAQPAMYAAITYPDPVAASSAVAISGAGPPAIIEAS